MGWSSRMGSLLAGSAMAFMACGDAEPGAAPLPVDPAGQGGGGGGQGGGGGEAPPMQDCEALTAAAQAALDASLEAERAASDERVGGTVAAVVSRDCTWEGATGHRDNPAIGDPTSLAPDALMAIASATKTYTAAAILLAAEDGLLGLDDTLAAHVQTGLQNEDTITIRQLLNHTSGVPNYFDDEDFLMAALVDPDQPYTPQELVDVAIGLGPAFSPGSSWGYSNVNYILLGMVLEAVTEGTAGAFFRSRLLEPRGLGRTFFPPEEELPEPITPGYFGLDNATGLPHPSVSWASGSMVSTALDLARWTRDLVAGDVLSPAMREAMQTFDQNVAEYGLGLFPREVAGVGTAVGHDGAIPGYQSQSYHLLEHELTVTIITNNRRGESFETWEAVAGAAAMAVASPGDR